MPQSYEPEFKEKIVRFHIEQGRTYKSITDEHGISKSASQSSAASLVRNAKPRSN